MTIPLTVAEILDQPALVPLWPTVGRALGLAESTTYQLAAEGRLPIECIRLGRRRVVRTVDLHRFLGLLPGNDDSAGYQPAPPVERISTSTCK
ncbi:helix-turn-helix domain-containing protein [Streptomyces sp. NPDC018833]|uniref:helix-turn-helix domain-containing protein n=1 Tax=Streptomyces sp. NPDC018833 TaxID=3365053 RepID=UPI003789717D